MSSGTCRNASVHDNYVVVFLDVIDLCRQALDDVHYCLVVMCFFVAEGFIKKQSVVVVLVNAVTEFLAEKVDRVISVYEIKIEDTEGVAVFAEYH